MLHESDRALVERLQSRDPGAVTMLIDTYGSKVYQLALRVSRNHHDAEEILQDVFLTVYRKIDSFRGEAAFSSWIYRITMNSSLSRQRGAQQTLLTASLDELPPGRFNESGTIIGPVKDWSRTGEEQLLDSEAREQIDRAIAELPAAYRAVIMLRDVEGLSNEEVASILEVSVPTVKSRLHRARLALREKLAAYFDRQPAGS